MIIHNKYLSILASPSFIVKIVLWSIRYYVHFGIKFLTLFKEKDKSVIVFDYKDGIYSDFYINIYRQLKKDPLRSHSILIAYSLNNPKWFLDSRYEKKDFVPESLLKYYRKYVLIAATIVHENHHANNRKVTMVQILHGFGSFGTAFGKEFLVGFDKVMVPSPYHRSQLLQKQYNSFIAEKDIISVGFPKLDGRIINVASTDAIPKIRQIFYGPTYHRDISSIFHFLEPLIEYVNKNDIILCINLHPLLYKKYNVELSGGIDWENRLSTLAKGNTRIIFLRPNLPFERIRAYYEQSDYFITDNSGAGYEYCLITGRPVVFLGRKLKVPVTDIHNNDLDKYQNYPEIKYRGMIGPKIEEPEELGPMLDVLPIEMSKYSNNIDVFRSEFVYNLGNAAMIASEEIKIMQLQLDNSN